MSISDGNGSITILNKNNNEEIPTNCPKWYRLIKLQKIYPAKFV